MGGGALLTWLTGAVLTLDTAAPQLLGLMLFCVLAGFVAALRVAYH